jgi:hypothetical protein
MAQILSQRCASEKQAYASARSRQENAPNAFQTCHSLRRYLVSAALSSAGRRRFGQRTSFHEQTRRSHGARARVRFERQPRLHIRMAGGFGWATSIRPAG